MLPNYSKKVSAKPLILTLILKSHSSVDVAMFNMIVMKCHAFVALEVSGRSILQIYQKKFQIWCPKLKTICDVSRFGTSHYLAFV